MEKVLDRLGFFIDQANLLLKNQKLRSQGVTPKVPIWIQTDQYILKTVETVEERTQVFRLRYRVFHRELMQKRIPFGFDIDALDFKCDHLVIIDRKSEQVIGTYRMLCSLFVDRFYSDEEFDLQAVKGLDGIKLELGRACVDERFRNGAVLNLLWRGIGEYIRKTGASYLLGCSSIPTTNLNELTEMMNQLRKAGVIAQRLWCETNLDFRAERVADRTNIAVTEARLQNLFPPLIASYLKAGAKVCGGPAVDLAMKCSDVLTVLNVREMNPIFAKRYNIWSVEA